MAPSSSSSFSWFSWQSNTQAASSSSDEESGGTPLHNLPRPPTDTFGLSTAEDRGTRIIEDIQNGASQCPICLEKLSPGNTREYCLWHCQGCYNVVHFKCIKDVAERNGVVRGIRNVWKCPYCTAEHDRSPRASCWCGQESFNFHSLENQTPNGCSNQCFRVGHCPHGNQETCKKSCHPGPCDWSCSDICVSPPMVPVEPPKVPTSWDRFCERWHKREKDCLFNILWPIAIIVCTYAFLSIYVVYRLNWWTQPLNYPTFTESTWVADTAVVLLLGMFLAAPSVLLHAYLFSTLWKFLAHLFNLGEGSTNLNHQCFKELTNAFGKLLLFLIVLGLFVLPFIGFAGGPEIAWYNQMRNSCNGFDIRVAMDSSKGFSSNYLVKPAQVLEFQSLVPTTKDQMFHLAPHLDVAIHSSSPFQSYYRLSRSGHNTRHIAVDVDVQKHAWRIMHLNDTDLANKWLATGHHARVTTLEKGPKLPEFSVISARHVKNGTFNKIDSHDRHLRLPSLDLVVADMYEFMDSCFNEPNLRVFKTAGRTEGEVTEMVTSRWDTRPNNDIVIRSASFGHGQQHLSMCLREGPLSNYGLQSREENRVYGVADDLLVPVAIISAMRLQAWDWDLRGFKCFQS